MSEEIKTTEVNKSVEEENSEKTISRTDKALEIWDSIYMCCHFLPILTTVSLIISEIFHIAGGWAETFIIIPLCFIGWGAALLTGPVRLLKVIVKCTSIGWNIGIIVPLVPICFATGAICAVMGFAVGLFALMIVPAAFTIYYFFAD